MDAGTSSRARIGLILHDNVLLRDRPSGSAPVIAALVQQTQVEVIATRSHWSRVRIWASVPGWVQRKEIVFRRPWVTTSTYRAPEVHYHRQAHPAQPLGVPAVTTDTATLVRSPGLTAQNSLPRGTHLKISAWQQDANGVIWYRVGTMWVQGDAVQFTTADPARTRTGDGLVSARANGKGMWLTLGTVTDSSSAALVQAARRAGMTHLYVEAAISPLGFHGRRSVGHLLRSAHHYHVAVIAWVYPYLYDVASDVQLTRTVAAFHAASGDRFDGIAADLERNVTQPNVRAYSQLVRAFVGPRYLLVGVTYPPQSSPDFPYADVAHTYNVIAPMDYWHETSSDRGLDYGHMSYGYDYGFRYAADSIRRISRTTGAVSIAPIGQTFDNYGRLEMGPHAPSAQEIQGFLQGSKAAGASGVSFFQWMTATNEEWRTIQGFRFR
ncbi:MAG: hypothetical protein NVSMB22_19370 [Chloroflexota bacterium]